MRKLKKRSPNYGRLARPGRCDMQEWADTYQVVLLDCEGSELGARPAANLVAAKQEIAYLLSEAFAAEVGSTQRALGSAKVEVRDAQGLCVLDMDL